MTAVTSLDDPRLAPYRWTADPARLLADGLLVVEGRLVVPRLLELAAQPGRWAGAALSVLLSPAAATAMAADVDRHPGVPIYVAPQDVMDALVGFNMHRGCLALARRPEVPAVEQLPLATARRLIVLEGVNNPDNIGGIFRSGAALGADLVVVGPGCADPLYRKSVRTSMGATLELPYASAAAWPGTLRWLHERGFQVAALTTNPAGAESLPHVHWGTERVALVAGAEGTGLSAEALELADQRVTIPMTGRVDSLNVATAVSIALYHGGVSERP